MAAHMNSTDLGFLENNLDSWLLLSRFFPSKVGGRPAWLSLSHLPTPTDLACTKCGEPCVFLLQVYAPREQHTRAFHRTVFLFICRNHTCSSYNSSDNFKVFRSQLQRENDFYSPIPPDETLPYSCDLDKKVGVALCVVCGCHGSKRCGQCHMTSYCSKKHQTLHWKAGHKAVCAKEPMDMEVHVDGLLFPEAGFVMEEEKVTSTHTDREKSEAEKMGEYQEYLRSQEGREMNDLDKEELEKMADTETADNKQFVKFKARIAPEPDQVLRYEIGGTPLWISASHLPQPGDVPPCNCGAPRHFEFQVLPQLLVHLKVDSLGDSIDWGTLCIYTCSESCNIGNTYQQEFLWKQDIAKTTPQC